MGRRIASESKQTVRGGPKPAKVGLHRRLHTHITEKIKNESCNCIAYLRLRKSRSYGNCHIVTGILDIS